MADYDFLAKATVDGTTVAWELCYVTTGQCGDGRTTPYPDVSVPVNHSDQTFSYVIKDSTGLGIVFSPDPVLHPPPHNDGPLWIKAGQKPNHLVVAGQIKDVTGAGTTELRFTDKNSHAVTLKYQLNFIDRDGNAVTAIDPDIKNGGKTLVSYTTEIAIGTALALIVLAAWWSKVKADRRKAAGGLGGAGSNPGG